MESGGYYTRSKRAKSSLVSCRKRRRLENNEEPAPDSAFDDECAICKETIVHKCFSDGCSHIFCFCCLLKWSLEKTECPLCKAEFEYIILHIDMDTYTNYLVPTRRLRYQYPSARTLRRVIKCRLPFYQIFLDYRFRSNRRRLEPHLSFLFKHIDVDQLPSRFRQKIYEKRVFVNIPPGGAEYLAVADFYEQYPSYFPRLVNWVKRELTSLWPDNQSKVSFMLVLIMTLFVNYSLCTMEFLCLLKPYMYAYCNHFVHELYAFAISRHDMEVYDTLADYGLCEVHAYRKPPSTKSAVSMSEENTSFEGQGRRRKRIQKQPPQPLKMILRKRA